MNLRIVEAFPGQWRWEFSDAAHRVVASSALFSSPQECWLSLAQLNGAAATAH